MARSIDEGIIHKSFGINKEFLHADTWCSRYNQAANSIDGGTQIDKVCAWWNGETTTYAYMPNSIRIPNGCLDQGLIWDYGVDVEGTNIFSENTLHVTMDPVEKKIRITPLPGPNIKGTYKVTVTATDPSLFIFRW